jgi:GMP synthase-like glutamine amidotransferase
MGDDPHFHFANFEHVTAAPSGATVMAMHEKVPVAALDYGGAWFSTQFHPEASVATLSRAWRGIRPELSRAYTSSDAGVRLIENFIDIAGRRREGS